MLVTLGDLDTSSDDWPIHPKHDVRSSQPIRVGKYSNIWIYGYNITCADLAHTNVHSPEQSTGSYLPAGLKSSIFVWKTSQ